MPANLFRALALVAAAAFGLGGIIEARPRRGPDPVQAMDRALASLRPALPRHARVGLLVASPPAATIELDPLYVAQYALAPSLVRPIALSDCVARGPEACGAAQVEFLLVDEAQQEAVDALGAQLGFTPAAETSGFALLARRPP
jgi:hypothetical protein